MIPFAFISHDHPPANAVIAQCSGGGTATATIQLVSPPFTQFAAQLQLVEYYPATASIGTAQATVTGDPIAIAQTNSIAPSSSLTCRTQTLNLGSLAPGNYDVTWSTTENYIGGSTNIRTRTLSFSILPAGAVPSADARILSLLAVALAMIAVAGLRS